ncbi:hypothetical protein CRYUN_Cryun29cG0030800 [Craigia yunnanensis]
METHKIHYLQLLLKEKGENDVSKYVTKMRELEEKARKCYAEPLIRMVSRWQLRERNDLVFKVQSLRLALCFDLLLVENQLPFFVIWELYSMLEICDQNSFKKTVFEFFNYVFPYELHQREDWKFIKEINHLLHFIHHYWHHDPTNSDKNMNRRDRWNSIGCATKLEEVGMKFKRGEGNSLFDIRFESGTVKIPLVVVRDYTEGFLRNLVAFEKLQPEENLHQVTDFLVFMDYLIDSAKDVEILRQHGIIENLLGDNQAVATMFNRLCYHVIFYPEDFYYSLVFNQTKDNCERCQRWKKFIAYLKRNYFNSPWAPLVSIVPAFTLFLLALLQTMYSILPYTKKMPSQINIYSLI